MKKRRTPFWMRAWIFTYALILILLIVIGIILPFFISAKDDCLVSAGFILTLIVIGVTINYTMNFIKFKIRQSKVK